MKHAPEIRRLNWCLVLGAWFFRFSSAKTNACFPGHDGGEILGGADGFAFGEGGGELAEALAEFAAEGAQAALAEAGFLGEGFEAGVVLLGALLAGGGVVKPFVQRRGKPHRVVLVVWHDPGQVRRQLRAQGSVEGKGGLGATLPWCLTISGRRGFLPGKRRVRFPRGSLRTKCEALSLWSGGATFFEEGGLPIGAGELGKLSDQLVTGDAGAVAGGFE